MNDERLLTVAIHTYDKALELKALLEHEGIDVVLHNVNLSQPSVSSGVRVRIKEADLPLALRIIENSEIFIMPESTEQSATKQTILVPVDFSTYSMKATAMAFDIAERHGAKIVLLHAYVPPTGINLQISTALDFTNLNNDEIEQNEEQEAAEDHEMNAAAHQRLEDFCNKLRESIKDGSLPAVKFTTEIVANVPEDAILDVAKRIKPMIIVMGTRGADKKERELIGSVTAEVLDSCRQPVFTVPEQSGLTSITDVRNVVLIANLDQNDMLALDALTRLAPRTPMNINIVHIASRRLRGVASSREVEMMLDYCRTHYPQCQFSMKSLETNDGIDYLKKLDSDNGVSLIVIPNKRKNILARLFNPSLAHKLLFHADIPLIAIPV